MRKLDPKKVDDISFNCPVSAHLEKAKKTRKKKGYDNELKMGDCISWLYFFCSLSYFQVTFL